MNVMIHTDTLFRSVALAVSGGTAFLLLLASPTFGQPDAEVYGTFADDPMYTVIPPGTIPAINDPTFVSGPAATDQMSPEEPVLGVVIGGQARAYSTWQLDSHEIVNDTVGGVAIAATW
jgi:hypothetical protein